MSVRLLNVVRTCVIVLIIITGPLLIGSVNKLEIVLLVFFLLSRWKICWVVLGMCCQKIFLCSVPCCFSLRKWNYERCLDVFYYENCDTNCFLERNIMWILLCLFECVHAEFHFWRAIVLIHRNFLIFLPFFLCVLLMLCEEVALHFLIG